MQRARKTLGIAIVALALAGLGMAALYWHEWGAQTVGALALALFAVACLLVGVANVQRWQEHDACRGEAVKVTPPRNMDDGEVAAWLTQTSNNGPAQKWSEPEAQLRLVIHGCYLAGMDTADVLRIVGHECAAQVKSRKGAA